MAVTSTFVCNALLCSTPKSSKLYSLTTEEPLLYFYHPDHLGSAAWVTDSGGHAIQHLQYLPFGETLLDQRTTSWNTRYSFSAKEKDEESNYSYFGARYYNSDISIWLSVDPQAAKYWWITPYAYALNNPVKLVDPNGEDVVITGEAAEEATAQLQNKTNLQLKRGDGGKIEIIEGKAQNKADRMLKKAINNKDITVNTQHQESRMNYRHYFVTKPKKQEAIGAIVSTAV